MSQTYVIVGASLAGAKAAESLRERGFEGRVVLIGEESEHPYERPPLSKGYLLGSEDADSASVHDPDFYARADIELRLGTTARRIDRGAQRLELDDETLDYDKLLLATGSTARRLEVPGGEGRSVFYLRTLADATRLRERLSRDQPRVVVVGAGWIGLECAAAARGYDCQVTIVEPQPSPLHAALGAEMGEVFADLHRSHGVELRLNAGVTEIRGRDDQGATVITTDGESLDADVVVVGVGATPNVELAAEAGLTVGDGVHVDAGLLTSDPSIYAAGDIAAVDHPLLGRRVRVEHWENALQGGTAAGAAMAGAPVHYADLPYFFSDQYDLGMEFTGLPDGYDRVVVRGDREGYEFIAFWLAGGRVVAGMNVNIWDVTDDIQALIRSGAAIDEAKLADPSVPLTELG